MIYLLLTILMNIGLFLSFRSFTKFGINTLNAIVINYLVCVITGVLLYGRTIQANIQILSEPWISFPVILGVFFMATFYLMALTTQKYNVAVATITSKMSMLIPVLFGLYVFHFDNARFTMLNFLGLAFAVLSIVLCSRRRKDNKTRIWDGKYLLFLPAVVFIATGCIDTSINYINAYLITPSQKPLIPVIVFLTAFLAGIILLLAKREKIRIKDVIGGIYLGIPNFFSLYFLMFSLTWLNNNGAVLYPILNVGIIVSSTLASLLIFKEKLIKPNIIGLILSLVAIFLISYQDIISYFS